MSERRTMTLNLSEAEMNVLEALSAKRDMSKTALLRQALRMYQAIEVRLDGGNKLFLENEATKEKAEMLLL